MRPTPHYVTHLTIKRFAQNGDYFIVVHGNTGSQISMRQATLDEALSTIKRLLDEVLVPTTIQWPGDIP